MFHHLHAYRHCSWIEHPIFLPSTSSHASSVVSQPSLSITTLITFRCRLPDTPRFCSSPEIFNLSSSSPSYTTPQSYFMVWSHELPLCPRIQAVRTKITLSWGFMDTSLVLLPVSQPVKESRISEALQLLRKHQATSNKSHTLRLWMVHL